MKRFHVHVPVHDLAQSSRFHSTLFGAETSIVEDDYAKWLREDPRPNFAISKRAAAPHAVKASTEFRSLCAAPAATTIRALR